jgi:RHS repeat-associated protein
LGARYYSSSFGRFLIADWSASPEPVPFADLTNPQTLNLYAYVENNPLRYADPTGHTNGTGAGWGPPLLNDAMPAHHPAENDNVNGPGIPDFSSVNGTKLLESSQEAYRQELAYVQAVISNPIFRLESNCICAEGQEQRELNGATQSPDLLNQAQQATARRAQEERIRQDGPPVGSPEYVARVSGLVSAEATAGEKYILVPAAAIEAVGVGAVVGASASAEVAVASAGRAVDAAQAAAGLHQGIVQAALGATAAMTHSSPPRTPAGLAGYAVGKAIQFLDGFH